MIASNFPLYQNVGSSFTFEQKNSDYYFNENNVMYTHYTHYSSWLNGQMNHLRRKQAKHKHRLNALLVGTENSVIIF